MKPVKLYLNTLVAAGALLLSVTANAQCPQITTQPNDVSGCTGSNVTFSVTATGSSLQYQWQEKTNKSLVFLNISPSNSSFSGVNTSQLGVSSVGPNQTGNLYRCVITKSACNDVITNHVALTVNDYTDITVSPATFTPACDQVDVQISVQAVGGNLTYQWQENPGTGFVNISGGSYTGEQTANLTVVNPGPGLSGRLYRAVVDGSCGAADTSTVTEIQVSTFPTVTAEPEPDTVTELKSATFSITATGTDIKYQWQENPNTGIWSDLFNDAAHSGTKTPTLTVRADLSKNNFAYRCVVIGNCTGDTSLPAPLSVQPDLSVSNFSSGEKQFVIYPNPSQSDLITIKTDVTADITAILLTDMTGRKLIRKNMSFSTTGINTLDVSVLTPGVYNIQLLNSVNGITKTLRFVKQ